MRNYLVLLSIFLLPSCTNKPISEQVYESDANYVRLPPPLRTESQYIMAEMKLETDAILYNFHNCPMPRVSKWIVAGDVEKDTTTFAEGTSSLRIKNESVASYYLDASRIEGDSLFFSGKYKYSEAANGQLYFYMLQKDRYESVEHPPIPDSLVINNIGGSSEWLDFNIRAKIKDDVHEIYFGLRTKDVEYAWIDDLDIQVDSLPVYRYVKTHFPAEEDKEFDNGSGINLGELTPTMLHNLDVLGRVWGFVKYYHPRITDGDINWDYELFRVLPKVANASDKKTLNQALAAWINQLGDFPVTSYSVTDSTQYSCFVDNSWIKDRNIFTDEMINLLSNVENAVRSSKVNYYMIPFGGGPRHKNFRAEKSYNDIKWDDQGFRILTLFRFWNIMEYNFPYKYMTDKPWTHILTEYLPEIVQPESESFYQAHLMRLIAEINDSHGWIRFPNRNLSGTAAEKLQFRKYLVDLTETLNGEFCVETSYNSELQIGDIILSVDGKPIRDIYNELKPYVAASNEETLSRNLRSSLLSTKESWKEVTLNRNGENITLTLTDFSRGKTTKVKEMFAYERANKDIIFLNVGQLRSTEMVDLIEKNMSAKGIIFDLRQYPKDFMSFFKLSDVLLPDTAINLWFSSQQLAYPGHYKKYNQCPLGYTNPDYFKGKVAILVNEGTQSLGEMTAIALSNAPKAAVIGTTTAGADGNATSFVLPGNVYVGYTVFGAYYPDWEVCQRTGVKIDIQARPTAEDLRERKDALIERAIQYIRE